MPYFYLRSIRPSDLEHMSLSQVVLDLHWEWDNFHQFKSRSSCPFRTDDVSG